MSFDYYREDELTAFSSGYDEARARYQEWWEIVLEGEVFATLDTIAQEIGPEYAMYLDAGMPQ